ncbi:glycosyltransferase involved in cell wall biosynthesis [Litoreibacter meonggei]|uniref:Glycosyltransferase involved in cell wall biosynthesis n=1 Tax=Litoreibacter meonggei TaxID=1049199 RepID=A0A497V681_9RHOB|nr:glycosyltransferase family 4 protein [Litoreibacter meonggei]RLJ36218.1 glycosyltransferase involved in cell wall biosynthesis [Litoreibacter meonggei]
MSKLRVLILAESCNPDWPSLPVVGYKYARALAKIADVTLVTHVRNRENIEKAGELTQITRYIDTEWIAGPMYKLSTALRGGTEVAWSTNQIMSYPPYIAFERAVFTSFKKAFQDGEFDVIHRITPMSPALPSYLSGRTKLPFVIGPLNGNLDWPTAFSGEQKREREGLRKLRGLYRYLPYARSTYRKAACIMAAFQHTIDDIDPALSDRIVPVPEIGFDSKIFHSEGRKVPFAGKGQKHFLFAGRLVPYKVAEAAIRGFIGSETLKPHILHIVGDGPELERLEAIVAEAGAQDRVIFEGQKTQAEVADFMRRCDAFVFPSIRELGAGVVIEAMASGMVCIVTDYGAPGDLVANGRGVKVPLQPMDGLVEDLRAAMEGCITNPQEHAQLAQTAEHYATTYFDWDAKAAYTLGIYEAVLNKAPLGGFTDYV